MEDRKTSVPTGSLARRILISCTCIAGTGGDADVSCGVQCGDCGGSHLTGLDLTCKTQAKALQHLSCKKHQKTCTNTMERDGAALNVNILVKN